MPRKSVILPGPDLDRLVEVQKAKLETQLRTERQEKARLQAKVKDLSERLGKAQRKANTLQASVNKMRKAFAKK